MKILHTSDWHLGHSLYGRRRTAEFAAFLDWLSALIVDEGVDTLLIAGDVFDSTTPSVSAQGLYYRFLCRTAAACCRHVVIIAGNHDSPAFLTAPQELLRALHIHVIGAATENPADEVLTLHRRNGEPELIVCAVPYLRDRDLRRVEAGESIEDKENKLLRGIAEHYASVTHLAQGHSEQCGSIPIIAMGHLFAAGGSTVDGDGMRELYVGSLARVDGNVFPAFLQYVALGHLHSPQCVGARETVRYSGAPLPMSFSEAGGSKSVCMADITSGMTQVSCVPVPVFQSLERVSGDLETIEARLSSLVRENSDAWLEIIYDGRIVPGELTQRVADAVKGSALEVLRIKNNRLTARMLEQLHDEECLEDLDVDHVFARCLEDHEVPDEQRTDLTLAYTEAVASLYDAEGGEHG